MQAKLRQINRKQNDIGQYERQRKLKIQMQQYNQEINYSQTRFFSQCEQQLKTIANDAQLQQKVLRQKQKIRRLKKQSQNQQQKSNQSQKISEMLMINVIIDYLRSTNMNYTYSVIMREKNIISEDIAMKSQLAKLLNINQELQNDYRFNVPLLELIMSKLQQFNEQANLKRQAVKQISIQCELLTNNNQHNSMLLTELKLQQIRSQTQKRQKKHFENHLHLFKSQQLLKLKSDMNKLFEIKQQQLSEKYQSKIQVIIKSQTGSQPNQQQSKKLQQYLNQINSLKLQLRSIQQKNIKMQKQKLQHDCFQNAQIKTKIQNIETERKQLNQLKSQFQLALRNMGTKVEDLASQKQQIMTHNKRQTQEYLSKMKTYKQNKDYMIEKVYSTLKTFQVRIDHLSADNNKLYQENHILRNQIGALKNREKQQIQVKQDTKRHLSLSDLKVPSKNVSIGVTPQEFQENKELQLSKIESQKSVFSYTSQEFQDRIQQRAEQNQKINRLKLQMSLLKNNVKYLVMDFQ